MLVADLGFAKPDLLRPRNAQLTSFVPVVAYSGQIFSAKHTISPEFLLFLSVSNGDRPDGLTRRDANMSRPDWFLESLLKRKFQGSRLTAYFLICSLDGSNGWMTGNWCRVHVFTWSVESGHQGHVLDHVFGSHRSVSTSPSSRSDTPPETSCLSPFLFPVTNWMSSCTCGFLASAPPRRRGGHLFHVLRYRWDTHFEMADAMIHAVWLRHLWDLKVHAALAEHGVRLANRDRIFHLFSWQQGFRF